MKISWRVALIPILALHLWFSWPAAMQGLPYFQREDEAHHYNRLINMFKAGTLDPQYFHKPSLHFYLRLPAVALTYLTMKSQGQISARSELVTRDPYGVADYAFSASHIEMAQSARVFSLLISLMVLVLTAVICSYFTASTALIIGAAGLTAISPIMVEYAAVVGVDLPMTLFALLGACLCIRTYYNYSRARLLWCAFVCGLAISCKYNAAPIAVLPFLLFYLSAPRSLALFLIIGCVLAAGFFAGSPYILLHPQMFWQQMGYEVWHYAVAGHVGNEGQPGFPQLLFYANWLGTSALGWVALALSFVGISWLVLDRREREVGALLMAFPLLFLALMCMQKVNFVRNMIVLVPFLTIIAAVALEKIRFRLGKVQMLSCLLGAAALYQPTLNMLAAREMVLDTTESRIAVEEYVKANLEPESEIAIAGQIQISPAIFKLRGVTRYNQSLINPLDLYLSGFNRIVVGPGERAFPKQIGFLRKTGDFPGVDRVERIVINPHIESYEFIAGPELDSALAAHQANQKQSLELNLGAKPGDMCKGSDWGVSSTEGHCWLQRRRQVLKISGISGLILDLSEGDKIPLLIELMTPWHHQKLRVSAADWEQQLELDPAATGTFKIYQLLIPAQIFNQDQEFVFQVDKILSPQMQRISADSRRLGIAIRSIDIAQEN